MRKLPKSLSTHLLTKHPFPRKETVLNQFLLRTNKLFHFLGLMTTATVVIILLLPASVFSQKKSGSPLDELVRKIEEQTKIDRKVNAEREETFIKAEKEQAKLLADAKEQLKKLRTEQNRLKNAFDENESEIAKLDETLKYKMGTLGEIFGVVKQVAGDSKAQFENSIISAEFPERIKTVGKIAQAKELPTDTEMKILWKELLSEMVESGKTKAFQASVTGIDGKNTEKKVVRIGPFNLIDADRYLNTLTEPGKISELSRQPSSRFTATIPGFFSSGESYEAISIDPSRGAILSALIENPSLYERYEQGGLVGYVITAVLLIGLAIALFKLFTLSSIRSQIKAQQSSDSIIEGNPLGLIMKAYQTYKDKGTETLEIAIEEAMIIATKNIEKGVKTVKILAAIAPLLGLLGTVTGMIGTFQSMMLFGTGDPKIMAGGISQALVTTVLGLICAIPLILIHSFLASRSKDLTSFIEEKSIGYVAAANEEK